VRALLMLSCLPKLKEPHDKSTFLEEIFAFDEQLNMFPIAFNVISKAQLADTKIQQAVHYKQQPRL
jgi:hypothetical protein